jgi:hypothetical protein
MSEYLLLLQRGWQVVVRHRILWLLGLIAVIVGQDAVFNLRGALRLDPLADVLVNLPLSAADLVHVITPDSAGIIHALVAVGLGAILLVVGAAANGALLVLTEAVERGQAATLKVGVQAALKYLRPLIAVRWLLNAPAIGLALIALLIAGGQPAVTQAMEAAGLLAVFLIAGLITGALAGAIGVGAERACVFDGLGVIDALRQGAVLLRKHFTRYLVVTGIFIASALMVVFMLACPVSIFLSDTVSGLAQGVPLGTNLTPLLLGTPIGLAVGALGVIAYAFFTAFTSVVWTLVYRRYT